MIDKLMIMNDPSSEFYIASFSGTTGSGEEVEDEEGHNVSGASIEEIISNAAAIWGVDIEDTIITLDQVSV
jgi:hypothetical protein